MPDFRTQEHYRHRYNPNPYLPRGNDPLARAPGLSAGGLVAGVGVGAGAGAWHGGSLAKAAGTGAAGASLKAALGGGLATLGIVLTASMLGPMSETAHMGRKHFLNQAFMQSAALLQTPIGPSTQQAATMRQQMLMAMHNSAYALRGAIGQEARTLHR